MPATFAATGKQWNLPGKLVRDDLLSEDGRNLQESMLAREGTCQYSLGFSAIGCCPNLSPTKPRMTVRKASCRNDRGNRPGTDLAIERNPRRVAASEDNDKFVRFSKTCRLPAAVSPLSLGIVPDAKFLQAVCISDALMALRRKVTSRGT